MDRGLDQSERELPQRAAGRRKAASERRKAGNRGEKRRFAEKEDSERPIETPIMSLTDPTGTRREIPLVARLSKPRPTAPPTNQSARNPTAGRPGE